MYYGKYKEIVQLTDQLSAKISHIKTKQLYEKNIKKK